MDVASHLVCDVLTGTTHGTLNMAQEPTPFTRLASCPSMPRSKLRGSLLSELPQMMIDVLGGEYSPLSVAQSSEGGMRGKGLGVDQS